jgi:hypothetical protein
LRTTITPHRFVPALLMLLASVLAMASPAAAATTYQHVTSVVDGQAMALQQGKVVMVAPNKNRFDQQWQIFDIRSDGTFMMKNRAGLDACLSLNPTNASPDISGVKVVGCAGTNDVNKRWRQNLAGGIEDDVRDFIRNAASGQRLARFYLCFGGPCGPEQPALLGDAFAASLISQGYSITNFTWRVRQI